MSVFVALVVLQGSPKFVQKEIQARYDALDQAFRKRDTSILETLMTDDFTTDSPDGKKLNRAAALNSFKGLMLGAQHATWPRKIVKLSIEGPRVIAIVEGRFRGDLPGPDGKPHGIKLNTTVEDIWTHTAHGWRIRHSRTLNMVKGNQVTLMVGCSLSGFAGT